MSLLFGRCGFDLAPWRVVFLSADRSVGTHLDIVFLLGFQLCDFLRSCCRVSYSYSLLARCEFRVQSIHDLISGRVIDIRRRRLFPCYREALALCCHFADRDSLRCYYAVCIGLFCALRIGEVFAAVCALPVSDVSFLARC